MVNVRMWDRGISTTLKLNYSLTKTYNNGINYFFMTYLINSVSNNLKSSSNFNQNLTLRCIKLKKCLN